MIACSSSIDGQIDSEYRVEYWITDYHRKQIVSNIIIDTIYDKDILMESKWIQISKNNLDSALLNTLDVFFNYNDSIYCEINDSMFVEYSDTSFYINNINFWSKRGSLIVDITYDLKKGVILKYYPEKGFELLLKRLYYENGNLVKTEDFHELQEMNKEFSEKFYYRKGGSISSE